MQSGGRGVFHLFDFYFLISYYEGCLFTLGFQNNHPHIYTLAFDVKHEELTISHKLDPVFSKSHNELC